FNLTDNGSNDSGLLVPGTYSVNELVPTGWALTDVVITDLTSGRTRQGSSRGGNRVSGLLGPGQEVPGLVNNPPATGVITVVKEAQPHSSQTFAFSTTGLPQASFGLTDDGTSPNSTSFTSLLPGTYSVQELLPAGWDLTGLQVLETGGQQNS